MALTLRIDGEDDVGMAAQQALALVAQRGLDGTVCHKLDLLIRELAWNLVRHAGGGTVFVEEIERDGRRGFRVRCQDRGPGIGSLSGHRSVGLGVGMGAIVRQSDEFSLCTSGGTGTQIESVLWWPSRSS